MSNPCDIHSPLRGLPGSLAPLFGLVLLLVFGVFRAPARGVEFRSLGSNAAEATTRFFKADWKDDGSFELSWRRDPSRGDLKFLLRPAELTVSEPGEEPERWRRQELRSAKVGDQISVTEVWSGPREKARVLVTTQLGASKPYLPVSIVAENLEDKRKQLNFSYLGRLPESYGKAEKLLGFLHRKQLDTGLVFDFSDLPENKNVSRWGTRALSWVPPGKRQRLNLPILCVFGKSRDGGPVVFSENRTSFGWEATTDHLGVFKKFYLRPEAGDRDDGIDLRDGDGKLPYRFYVGYVDAPRWDKLYLDYYLDAFPYLKGFEPAGPVALEPGSITGTGGVFDQTPLELDWEKAGTRAAASSGASFFMVWYQHGDRALQEKLNLAKKGVEFVWSAGMVPVLWDNVKVAPLNNPDSATKFWSESFDHIHFKDSWYTDISGQAPHKSWEGFACNQSPSLSFGRHELETVKEQFAEFGYRGFFLDYYGAGGGVDYVQGYDGGRYPFLPEQVTLSDYTREIADWLHENNHIFIANVPEECLGVVRFADYYFGDIGKEWGRIYKITIGARPFVVTGLTSEAKGRVAQQIDMLSGGLMFGYLTSVHGWGISGWAYTGLMTEPERSTVLDLNARNNRFLFDLSSSLLVGGDLGKQHFFLSPSGRVFATARNETAKVQSLSIPFDSPRLNLVPGARYSVFQWDIDGGATLREANITGEKLSAGLSLELSPGQAKALIVLNHEEKILQPYLAAVPDEAVYTRSSTAKIVSVKWTSSDGKKEFLVTIDAPWGRSVTDLALPAGVVADVSVRGASDFRKETIDGVLRLRINHDLAVPGGETNALQPVLTDAGVSGKIGSSRATIVVSW